jgi:hypothetical protein
MIGQPLVLFLVELKYLPLVGLLHAGNIVKAVGVPDINSMDAEKTLVMADILRIDRVEIALAKRKVMNGIQQVRLAGTVISNKTIDFVREKKRRFLVILKICDR